MAKAWDEVTPETIKNCFSKCGFNKKALESEDDLVDEEFLELFKELTDSEDSEMTAEEYIDFYIETCASVPVINSDEVDWRVSSVEKCVSEYLRKESGVSDIEEVPSNDDDDDDGDEYADKNEEKITTYEALTMVDKLINLKDLSTEDRENLSSLKERLETVRINSKKQSSIKNFFE